MSDQNDLTSQLGDFMGKLQDMQSKAQDLEAQAGQRTAEGQSGGGMVKVVANGRMELVSVSINKEAIDPNDPDMLEDLVLSATNQALRAAKNLVAQDMAGLASGMGFPFGGM